jgi:hypothetical protein
LQSPVCRERIVEFFSGACPNEMLLYICGHGIKNQQNRTSVNGIVQAHGVPDE